VLSDTLAKITADFIGGETDQRQALATGASETTDAATLQYISDLSNLITPLQSLATTTFPQLLTALDSNALTVLDSAILATQTTSAPTVAALASQSVVDGDFDTHSLVIRRLLGRFRLRLHSCAERSRWRVPSTGLFVSSQR
jgi:hypothetical protein